MSALRSLAEEFVTHYSPGGRNEVGDSWVWRFRLAIAEDDHDAKVVHVDDRVESLLDAYEARKRAEKKFP